MLPDFLFLQGASHPGGSILPFEAVQLKEVFRQHGFPLVNGIPIFFLLINKVWDSSLWTYGSLDICRDIAPE
jgi:hypothetical protein